MKRKNKRNQRLCKALENEIVKVFSAILPEKDLETPQKGIDLTDNQTKNKPKHLHKRSETLYMSRNQRFPHLEEYRKEILQWQMKSVMQKNEDEEGLHVSATSFDSVVMEISKCIEGCLSDSTSHNHSATYLRQLLIDYKAVQSLHSGKTLISLHKVHLILQDNFSDSWFCKFLNIMLSESLNNTISNSIDV
jgi:hypothetical protein